MYAITAKKNQKIQKNKKRAKSTRPKSIASTVGGVAGKLAMAALKTAGTSLLGIPFEASGSTAVATPQNIGPIQVSAPSANGYIRKTSNAKMRSRGNGNVTVTHREYIADIVPETEDNNNVFQLLQDQNINPGNQTLFPWLSSIATRFESYIFRALRFIYEPQCSTGSVGTVSQVIDYDALDDPPLTKLQMMAYKGAVRSPPWFCSDFTADPKDLSKMKEYYVRNSAQQGPGDARVYDVGRYFLAYEGPADTGGAAGELYIEYIVELRTPNLEPYALSGRASLQGTALTPANLGLQTASGPLAVSIVGSGTSFLVGVSSPGTYLMSIVGQMTTVTPAGNQVIVGIPTGSNAQDSGFNEYPATLAAGDTVYSTTVPVFFPTIEDLVAILVSESTWAAQGMTSLSVIMTPLSEETFGFPTPAAEVTLPLAMRRGLAKLQRGKDMAERPASELSNRAVAMVQYAESRRKPGQNSPSSSSSSGSVTKEKGNRGELTQTRGKRV